MFDNNMVIRDKLVVLLNRDDTYRHLFALCQDDFKFSIPDYRKEMQDQDFERIFIADAELVDKQDIYGSIIGTVKLLPSGNSTTAIFVDKDTIWDGPIPESGELLFTQFIARVKDHFNSLNLLAQPNSQSNFMKENELSSEIASGLKKFRAEFGLNTKTAFIIMSFDKSKPYTEILKWIMRTLKEHDIIALRADHKEYLDDLFPNIKVYMHACDFGIAIIDRITQENFNPNVSLEVGYMLGLGKNVLLLKDKTLKSLPTDLTGKLYKGFDTTDVKATLPEQINKWLQDKGHIKVTTKKQNS